MIFAPALPSCSFEPVCSGCQCVLNNVSIRFAPVSLSTAFSSSPDRSCKPPSTSNAPPAPWAATTLQPAPEYTASCSVSVAPTMGGLASFATAVLPPSSHESSAAVPSACVKNSLRSNKTHLLAPGLGHLEEARNVSVPASDTPVTHRH